MRTHTHACLCAYLSESSGWTPHPGETTEKEPYSKGSHKLKVKARPTTVPRGLWHLGCVPSLKPEQFWVPTLDTRKLQELVRVGPVAHGGAGPCTAGTTFCRAGRAQGRRTLRSARAPKKRVCQRPGARLLPALHEKPLPAGTAPSAQRVSSG